MRPWTVLLLRPEYAANKYGHDTYMAYVVASNAEHAITLARVDALVVDATDEPNDYYCLLCTEGHIIDYSNSQAALTDCNKKDI